MEYGKLAADIHKRMCDDPGFGYSWAERWGAYPTKWTVDGRTFTIDVGDYDCSSSTITAWRKALAGTKYAHMLDGATFTGNMRQVFLASGLFEWKPVGSAKRGDLYLNEACHVAMCQGGGMLSEFSSSETGGIYGQRGDQTGWESHVTNYYSYPWDGVLHYNGKLDKEEDVSDAYDFMTAKVDPTGRGKRSDMRTRLAYMAEKQEKMQSDIGALERKLDAIAEKVAKALGK